MTMKLSPEALEELGLMPVWRLRTQAPAPAQSEQPAPEREQLIAGMDWAALQSSVAECRACELHKTRQHAVFGVGDAAAGWLFVGEAPGAEEDLRGEPFVGQAGKLLDNMLAAIGLKRGQGVYIANVLKSRPPQNRNPEPAEVRACLPYLRRQIELIEPKIIVTLGRFAAQALLGRDASLASLRGQVHRYRDIPLVATYHPAYLLRSLPEKAKAWQDMCLAVSVFEGRLKQTPVA